MDTGARGPGALCGGGASNAVESSPNAAWNGLRSSIGIGKTSVEFFSTATSETVCR